MPLPTTRRAVLLDRLEHFVQQEIPLPPCGERDAVVRIRAVGICGSDLTYYSKGGSTIAPVKYPHLLGHEAAGEVVQVGAAVEHLKPGDRVAIEPGHPCGHCHYCDTGQYNLCPEISFMSTPIYRPYSEGAFVEYSVRPAQGLHRLPDTMSFEAGAMLEPLAVAMQAVETAGTRLGMRALVLGCGPIAICLLLSLRAAGVSEVFMVDIVEERVEMAAALGATASQNLDVEAIRAATGGLGVDLVFDTTDHAPLINRSIGAVKKGGSVLLLSVPHSDEITLDIRQIFLDQIFVLSSFRYAHQYPRAIELVGKGIIPLERIITHRFSFADADEAFRLAVARDGGVCKIALHWE